eukprot:gene7739-9909_t
MVMVTEQEDDYQPAVHPNNHVLSRDLETMSGVMRASNPVKIPFPSPFRDTSQILEGESDTSPIGDQLPEVHRSVTEPRASLSLFPQQLSSPSLPEVKAFLPSSALTRPTSTIPQSLQQQVRGGGGAGGPGGREGGVVEGSLVVSVMKSPSLLVHQRVDGAGVSSAGVRDEAAVSRQLITRRGLVQVPPGEPSPRPPDMLDITHCSVASRMCALGVVTDLKEVFLFDVSASPRTQSQSSVPPPPSLRLNLDVLPTVSLTVFLLSDVRVVFESQDKDKVKERGSGGGAADQVDGSHVIVLTGDVLGVIRFVLCSRSAVLSSGTVGNHLAAIDLLLPTASSTLPLWVVKCAYSTGRGGAGAGVSFGATAGSSVLTLCREGDVRIWQPTVALSVKEVGSSDRVMWLGLSTVSWTMAATFSSSRVAHAQRMQPIQTPLNLSLDPSCLSVIIAFGNGHAEQWPVPGLVPEADGIIPGQGPVGALRGRQLGTVTAEIWSSKCHQAPISSLRTWVALSDDVVVASRARDVVVGGEGHVASSGPEYKPHIGYTQKQMRTLASSSSMVTCGIDSSLVLWRFVVSDEIQSTLSPQRFRSRYLLPTACRRMILSVVPTLGLCFPVTATSTASSTHPNVAWYLTAVMCNEVQPLMKGSWVEVMSGDEA